MNLTTPQKDILIIIVLIILFAVLFVIFNPEIFNSQHARMSITKINENGIPKGPIVHMADEDFIEYPFLVPIIRDNSQQAYPRNDGTRIDYYLGLSKPEYCKMMGSKFYKNPTHYYFEYNGTFYSFVYSGTESNLTISKINDGIKPDGEIVQISDDDFDKYPYLAPVFKNQFQSGIPDINGTRIEYVVEIPDNKRFEIRTSKFFPRPDLYVEYKGNYYSFGVPWIS
jgi:hypothetical protein